MAVKTLRIVVVSKRGGGGSGSGSGKNKSDKKNMENSTLYKMLNYNQTIKNKVKQAMSPLGYYTVSSAASIAKQTARNALDYIQSDIGRKNGDSNYQAIVSRNIEVATDIASFAGNILGGAASGAAFGPAGAVVGAIAGAATGAINLGFKYSDRERSYQHELFKEENSIAVRRARADFNLTTGRVR